MVLLNLIVIRDTSQMNFFLLLVPTFQIIHRMRSTVLLRYAVFDHRVEVFVGDIHECKLLAIHDVLDVGLLVLLSFDIITPRKAAAKRVVCALEETRQRNTFKR